MVDEASSAPADVGALKAQLEKKVWLQRLKYSEAGGLGRPQRASRGAGALRRAARPGAKATAFLHARPLHARLPPRTCRMLPFTGHF